uniref:Uncharacterized protein n=1 Tax=Arundo donax TaxID=35708 RepID=A0A0A9AE00_ARUDO
MEDRRTGFRFLKASPQLTTLLNGPSENSAGASFNFSPTSDAFVH